MYFGTVCIVSYLFTLPCFTCFTMYMCFAKSIESDQWVVNPGSRVVLARGDLVLKSFELASKSRYQPFILSRDNLGLA